MNHVCFKTMTATFQMHINTNALPKRKRASTSAKINAQNNAHAATPLLHTAAVQKRSFCAVAAVAQRDKAKPAAPDRLKPRTRDGAKSHGFCAIRVFQPCNHVRNDHLMAHRK